MAKPRGKYMHTVIISGCRVMKDMRKTSEVDASRDMNDYRTKRSKNTKTLADLIADTIEL